MIKIVPITPFNYAIDYLDVGQKKYEWKNADIKKIILKKIRAINGVSWCNCWGRSKTDPTKEFTEIEIRIALKFNKITQKKQDKILEKITQFIQNEFIQNEKS